MFQIINLYSINTCVLFLILYASFLCLNRSWLRGALVLLCLLGITWAFGLMYVSEDLLVFAYIFTIANAFQGLFIFIFHCCMNDKVCVEYRTTIKEITTGYQVFVSSPYIFYAKTLRSICLCYMND